MNKISLCVLGCVLAGCGGGTSSGDDGVGNNGAAACTDDFGCDLGTFCIDGACLPTGDECAQSDDCGLGRVCNNGHCVTYVPDCVEDTDCGEGEVCLDDVCVAGCRGDDDCGRGERCEDFACERLAGNNGNNGNNGAPCGGPCPEHQRCEVQTQSCGPDGTCATDDHCTGQETCLDGVCTPPPQACTRNAECAPSEFCNRESMRCEPGCREANQCREDEVCAHGVCGGPPECIADENEPNDSADAATGVGAGGAFDDLTLCEEDDWFSFLAFAGDDVTIEATFVHDLGNINLQLFRPDGELLQQVASQTDREQIALTLGETGRYTLRVHGAGRGVFNTYDLRVALTRNCTDDDFEPNNTADTATALGPGAYPDRRICGDDPDWHEIALYTGETLTASIVFSADLGQLALELHDADGALIERAETEGDGESITFTADAPQVVRVLVPGDADLINGYNLALAVAPPDCAADALEEDDVSEEASDIAPGEVVAGTLCAEDPDWYTLVLPADVSVSLSLTFDHAAGNLDLFVFADDGLTPVAASETDGDVESIEFDVDEPGRYFVQVAGRGRSQGEYTLRVDGGPTAICPDDDRFEDNDTLEQSAVAGMGRHGDIILCEGDDSDWFQVPLAESQSVEVYVLYLAEEGQLEVDLFAPEADEPFHTAAGPAPTKRVRAPLGSPPGVWNVHVRRTDGASVRYALRVFVYDGPLPLGCEFDDELEPNDLPRDAARVAPGAAYEAIVCGANPDWFRVDARAGQIVNVRVEFEHAAGNIDAVLHAGQPLAEVARSTSETDAELLRFQAVADGPVFLEVLHDGEFGNRYTVTASVINGPVVRTCELDDPFEPNDIFAGAPLTAPGVYTAIHCGDDADFFGVDLAEGQLLRATLGWEGDAALELAVWGPGNEELATARDAGLPALQVVHTAAATGRFALSVTSEVPADALYTLRFEVLDAPDACGDADAAEPNDAVDAATPLADGERLMALGLCGADEDWFRVEVPRRSTVRVDAAFDGDGNLDLEAFRHNGGAFAASHGFGPEERLLLAADTTDEVFYVRAFLRDAAGTASYSLGISAAGPAGCGMDENEPNETRPTATAIRTGTVEGLTLCTDDVDWFLIQSQPFQFLDATIAFDHSEHNLGLAVFDASVMQEVARSDGNGNTETVSWISLFGGPLYIQVFGSGGDGTEYSMTVDLQ